MRLALLEYTHSLEARRRLRDEVLPSAKKARDKALTMYQGGEVDIQDYLTARSAYDEAVGDYLKAAVRRRPRRWP